MYAISTTITYFPKITIISTFKNSRKQSCKLAEIQNSYLIFCQNKDGFWEVSLDFTNNQQD
jgi:hypothetical protein